MTLLQVMVCRMLTNLTFLKVRNMNTAHTMVDNVGAAGKMTVEWERIRWNVF